MHSKQMLNYYAVSEKKNVLFLAMLFLYTIKTLSFYRLSPIPSTAPLNSCRFSTWLLHDSGASTVALQLPAKWKTLICSIGLWYSFETLQFTYLYRVELSISCIYHFEKEYISNVCVHQTFMFIKCFKLFYKRKPEVVARRSSAK